jgi:dynein heavy chain
VLARLDGMLPGSTLDEARVSITELLMTALPAAIGFVRAELREEIPSVDCNLSAACCNVFESLVNAFFQSEELITTFESAPSHLACAAHFRSGVLPSDMSRLLERFLSFSLAWGVGGNLDAKSRSRFSEWFRTNMSAGRFPRDGSVFDYFINPKTGEYQRFDSVTAPFRHKPATPFADIVVPTIDTTRYQYVLERLCSKKHGVLLVGPTGTGKSVIVNDSTSAMAGRHCVVSCGINFSAQSSSARTEQVLELALEKKRKGLYGAPPGKILVLFVDDVNMPRRDLFGSQPPVELLRQVLDTSLHFRPGGAANPPFAGGGGFYTRKKYTWNSVENLVIIAACAPPGGGRNHMTPRFSRHLTLLSLPPPSKSVLTAIFSTILDGHLKQFEHSIRVRVPVCIVWGVGACRGVGSRV